MKTLLLVVFQLCLFAASCHAQIIYTDVIPDTTFYSGDTCHLDLNNDGVMDFIVRHSGALPHCSGCPGGGGGGHAVKIDALSINDVAITDTVLPYPRSLLPLEVIGPTLYWAGGMGQVLVSHGTHCISNPFGPGTICVPTPTLSGVWSGNISVTSPRYLGLRIIDAGLTYYGWARLSVPAIATTFTLKDYAYNSVPDELILAGDTGSISLGVRGENVSEAAGFFPNPFSESTTLVLMPKVNEGRWLTLTDLFGREVRRIAIAGAQTTIERGDLASGFYFYRVADGEHIVATGKIIVD